MSDAYIPKATHYINNEVFYAALVERKAAVQKALENNEKLPVVSDYIANCIMLIAQHYSYRPNFNAYTFRDEFVADGIYSCLKKVDSFDPSVSRNGFWYFTQICHNVFVRKILDERKISYIKAKIVSQIPFDLFDLELQDSENDYPNEFLKEMQQTSMFNNIIEKEELRMSKKKSRLEATKVPVPVVAGPLDMLFEDE